jgi:hypothetical protein
MINFRTGRRDGIGRMFSGVPSGHGFYFAIYQTPCVWLISSYPFGTTHADDLMTSPARTAPGELAIFLAVALAVQDVRAQRGGIELRGDGRQALIIDGCGHQLALGAVKPLAQPDVIPSLKRNLHYARQETVDSGSCLE